MGDEVVGLVLKVGGLRVAGVEVLRRGGIGVWERCVEDVCGVGRWVVVVVVGIEAFVEMSGLWNLRVWFFVSSYLI